MSKRLKDILARYPRIFRLAKVLRHPLVGVLGFLYGAYLTVRYVDEYREFPAIEFQRSLVRLKIHKGMKSSLTIHGKLIVVPWLGGCAGSTISVGDGASAVFSGDFSIGDDVRILVSEDAQLLIGGKHKESASGITMRSTILVYRHLEIGRDCIVAWDTFITDCDWHPIEGSSFWGPTTIGEHVWVGPGAKILKGANIGADTIVGPQSVVLSGDYPPRSLLTGAKARVAKTNIKKWRRDIESHTLEVLPDHA